MRLFFASTVALALIACNDNVQTGTTATTPSSSQSSVDPETAASRASDAAMTPEDPDGFTLDGFTFQTRPGAKHVVRLPSPGTDTWRVASSGDPTVKQTATRKETTADGKPALVFEYEMLQAGNAALEFERLEDGAVEGKRTITFNVQ